jgi:hypothetical protein
MAEHDKANDKPFVVTLLAIISLALGISGIVGALITLVIGSDIIIGNIQILASLDLTVGAIVSIILALLFIIIGFGLWKLMGWPKTILLVISMLGVIIFPLKGLLLASSLADKKFKMDSSDIFAVIFSVLGVILSVFILWYLSRPKVILAFEAKEMTSLKNRIRGLEERIELGRQRCNAGEISKAELSRLRSDCIAEERLLRARIRHFEKLRLSRERKIKEKLKSKDKARKEKEAKKEEKWEEKEARKEEKEAEKEEKEAEKEEKKKTKEEEEKAEEEEEKEKEPEEVVKKKKKVKKVKKEEPEEEAKEGKKKKVKKVKKEEPKGEAEEEVKEESKKKKKKVKKVKKEKPEEGEIKSEE